MEIAIIVWIFCGIGAAIVAQNRGANGFVWFWLGALFGPIGLAFSFASGSSRSCPACRKRVHPEASKCPHCQTDLRERIKFRCSGCKAENEEGAHSCVTCGASFPSKFPRQNCKHAIPDGAKFCPECGATVTRPKHGGSQAASRCVKCNVALEENDRYCSSCGAENSAPQPSKTVEPPPPLRVNSRNRSRNNLIGITVLVGIIAGFIAINSIATVGSRKPHFNTAGAAVIPTFTSVPDSPDALISRCPGPSVDDSTAYDKPRPFIVTRWIEYGPEAVKVAYVPSARAGEPPPYSSWTRIGCIDLSTKQAMSCVEAAAKLQRRCR